MSTDPKMGRREFLRASAAGAAVAAGLSAWRPRVASARVLGANDRINMAVIGVGGMGSGHLHNLVERSRAEKPQVQVVAVCDVWDRRKDNAVSATGGTAKGFRDYREVLRLPEVDAVVIATPDHWHAKISIDAMRAGKDVYCEKPMTLYWDEAKEVARVARETGRVFQCGAQSASDDAWWQAQRIVRAGGIGKVIWSQSGAFRNDPNGDWNWPIQDCKPGVDLDWDMWLGHEFGLAPKRKYDPERYSRFRKYWDYSGGLATDLLYHSYAHLLIGLGPEMPLRVSATGTQAVHGLENDNREVPDTFHMVIEFPSRHTCHLMGTQESEDGFGDVIRGQMASLYPGGPGLVIRPQRPFQAKMLEVARGEAYQDVDAEVVTGKNDRGEEVLEEIRVATRPRSGHMDNFLECVRSRRQPHLNADLAYQVMVPIALAVRAYRERRVMEFDPKAEKVVGDRGIVRPWKRG